MTTPKTEGEAMPQDPLLKETLKEMKFWHDKCDALQAASASRNAEAQKPKEELVKSNGLNSDLFNATYTEAKENDILKSKLSALESSNASLVAQCEQLKVDVKNARDCKDLYKERCEKAELEAQKFREDVVRLAVDNSYLTLQNSRFNYALSYASKNVGTVPARELRAGIEKALKGGNLLEDARSQLAASEAREVKLRESLKGLLECIGCGCGGDNGICSSCDNARELSETLLEARAASTPKGEKEESK